MSDFNFPEGRDQLIQQYADRIVENMSIKDMERILVDHFEENMSCYSDQELFDEVNEIYPDLLEETE